MLFFYFLCHLKKTDVKEIKTGNKIQFKSVIATAALDMNTISKKQNKTNPSTIGLTYTATRLGKQGLPNGSL